jgi:predicted lysophospholipase L1 biosynthesis ABC-type transport system permease subunit
MPRLAELLYWMACWIAATVAILTLSALFSGDSLAWMSVAAYFATAVFVWLLGRLILAFSKREKRRNLKRTH